MRQVGRFALALAVSGLIGAGFAAESRAYAAEANIWYVNPLPNTPDWGRSGKLFQDGAKANGYKATLTGPNKIDIPAMVSQIEQAIADGADGIITCPLDPAAFKGVIDEAKGKGLPLGDRHGLAHSFGQGGDPGRYRGRAGRLARRGLDG